jgi:hypothetical protein
MLLQVPLPRVVVDALSSQAERIAANSIDKLHAVARDKTLSTTAALTSSSSSNSHQMSTKVP